MAPLVLLLATFAVLFAINKYALRSRFSISLIGLSIGSFFINKE